MNANTCGKVADLTVSTDLDGYQDLLTWALGWAQERAALAIDLWAEGVRPASTVDGQFGRGPRLLVGSRPQLTGPFGIDQGLPETDPGAPTRRGRPGTARGGTGRPAGPH